MRRALASSAAAALALGLVGAARADAVKARLVGTHKDLACLALSPDGKTVATGSWDKTIKLWDVASGRELRTLAQHKGAVLSLAFSPDGQSLLSGGDDKLAVRWSLEGKVEWSESANHKAAVEAVAFAPDGKSFVTAPGLFLHVWKLSGEHRTQLEDPVGVTSPADAAHRRPIHALAFSPDGTKLASGSGDETVKLWSPNEQTPKRTFEGHSGRVTGVAFSPDGTKLASACSDHWVRVWDLGATTDPLSLECEESVNGLAFSPDGSLIAAATLEHTVLWTLADKTSRVLETEAPNVRAVAFLPDGKAVVTGSSDGGVRVVGLP